LAAKGYDPEDARDYVVAACWEYIIPGKGMEIPNIEALSFTKVIDGCLHNDLPNCADFPSFMECVDKGIAKETGSIMESIRNIYIEPAPFQSVLMDGCLKRARDISEGAKYNNYGLHGTGIANGADSLAAIKKYVFDEGVISPRKLIDAVDADFEGYYSLWTRLRYETPKMGNDDGYVDDMAVDLTNMFADAMESVRNERGGCFRAGSGTAMYYLWHVKEIGASPDGRKKGEPLPANFSPSLHAKLRGPVSIIKSFSRPDMKRIINGGPLTLELHDTVFRNEEGVKKVAQLVKSYMDMGGQQLQLNAVNREVLLDAQKHPGLYKNLIVRVWGWSGYFVELEKEYQDHIIKRTEFKI
ncbi:MAG: pyruvate formate-lyase, partial [Ruminiclostridium sp.]|nr:pyruvate formate-lyase [Ruminiclostridium sp.]